MSVLLCTCVPVLVLYVHHRFICMMHKAYHISNSFKIQTYRNKDWMRQGMEQAMNGLFMICICHFDSGLKVPHRYRPVYIYSNAQKYISLSEFHLSPDKKVRRENENKSSKWLQQRVKFKCMLYSIDAPNFIRIYSTNVHSCYSFIS